MGFLEKILISSPDYLMLYSVQVIFDSVICPEHSFQGSLQL